MPNQKNVNYLLEHDLIATYRVQRTCLIGVSKKTRLAEEPGRTIPQSVESLYNLLATCL